MQLHALEPLLAPPQIKNISGAWCILTKSTTDKTFWNQKHHKRKICIICTGSHPLKKELWPEWQNQNQKWHGKNHFAIVCKKGQARGRHRCSEQPEIDSNERDRFESNTQTSSYAREISMQTLNGFVNFLSKFLTHLADQIELIRCLTRQDTEFNWTEEHKNTFRKVKHLVITTPSPNTITTRRLWAWNPLWCQRPRSCSTTKRQTHGIHKQTAHWDQATIEIEKLVIVFSLEKFNRYSYRCNLKKQGDHKLLQSILKKSLICAKKGLQGMLKRLLK